MNWRQWAKNLPFAKLPTFSDDRSVMFTLFTVVLLATVFLAVALDIPYLPGIPLFIAFLYWAIADYKAIFWLLLACIPLSTEVQLPNGFGTDLPTEPLIVGLMVIYLLLVFRFGNLLDGRFFKHPITLLLGLHVAWIIVATIFSQIGFVSVKYLLAKLWYIVTFYFLAGHLLKNRDTMKRMLWFIFVPLLFTVLYVVTRHASYGFSFADVFKTLNPFYRNHVNYAAILVLFIPYIWILRSWYKHNRVLWWILTVAAWFFVIAIQLSYTRAAYIGLVAALGMFYVIKWKLTRPVLLAGVLVLGVGVYYLVDNDRYLRFSPDFEHTVSHYDFNSLVEATYQLKDISSMERVYRWVAGFRMVGEKPWIGYGPANFTNFYQDYSVTSFRTYVSDNIEKSGIHCYYLMVATEQGIPGALLFILLVCYTIVQGERTYHLVTDPQDKQIVMAATLSFVVIAILQLINDLLEADKVGPFFFLAMAWIVNMDIKAREK